ncbi:D-inositol 3-phosphate glycosyltransferase [Rubripirellula tenax]|uniref:D-inositol 3-phosphate glycosyltransferase n=2 Tax=Rubripirellula tenax TaxID=2528015 RepID=A0A5C6EG76_9BACT|nr:D-inositol 3-phosphate glycosyltransferase [Rubripirellula tenax]
MSDSDVRGGANVAAYRLHVGLRQDCVDSQMLVRRRFSEDASVRSISTIPYRWRFLSRALTRWHQREVKRHRLGSSCDTFSSPHASFANIDRHCAGSDIINMHWVTFFLDLPTVLSRLTSMVPVAWTLHDMNAFTGGCHYSGPCDRYRSVCERCPELNSDRSDDLANSIFRKKVDYYSRLDPERFCLVAPSRWLQQASQESVLLSRFQCAHIPYGVDTRLFSPGDRVACRARWNLPPDKFVLLFVASSTSNHRKGLDLLIASMKMLKNTNDVVCLCVGDAPPQGLSSSITVQCTGVLRTPADMAMAYNAADVLVVPSRQDNLPNTILESLACGTPVIGFAVGGIPDMVRDGETGYICEDPNSFELAKKIELVRDESAEGVDFSSSCRRVALDEYRLEIQSAAYKRFFEERIQAFASAKEKATTNRG